MRFGGRLRAALGMACFALLALSVNAAASFDWQTRAGTIEWAKGLADGTHVYLDAEEISKIRAQQSPAYIVVQECFSANDKIIVLTQPSLLLRVGQTVDIEGDLTTLDSGDRAIINATVWGYTDSSGTLLYHGPLVKGIGAPTPWAYKIDLTVTSSGFASTEQSQLQPAPSDDVKLFFGLRYHRLRDYRGCRTTLTRRCSCDQLPSRCIRGHRFICSW